MAHWDGSGRRGVEEREGKLKVDWRAGTERGGAPRMGNRTREPNRDVIVCADMKEECGKVGEG